MCICLFLFGAFLFVIVQWWKKIHAPESKFAIQKQHASTIETWTNAGWIIDDVFVAWKHIEDAQSCDKYDKVDKVIQEEKWEEVSEEWVAEDTSTYMKGRGPDCRLTHRDVLVGSETHIINGKAVSRDSWKDKQIQM